MKQLTIRVSAVAAAALLTLSGCGSTISPNPDGAKVQPAAASTPSTSEPGNFPPNTNPDANVTPPAEEAADDSAAEDGITESKFGKVSHFKDSETEFQVRVNKPVKAKCQYASIGCTKPETGDQVLNFPITIKNTGKAQLEVSGGLFEIEFDDGTRMGFTDGNAMEYGPDNTLDFDVKVRPGGTLKTSMTFEAPKKGYGIVMVSNMFGGEDLHIWK